MSEPMRASALLVGFADTAPAGLLREAGYGARVAPPWAALQAVREGECGLLVVRLTGASTEIIELLDAAREARVPVLAVVANEETEKARAWEAGAADLAVEPFGAAELGRRIGNMAELASVRAEVARLEAALGDAKLALEEARGTATLQSLVDELTGVANVKRFYGALELEWKRAARSGTGVSLLLADLDHFRVYNERSGRASGDDCLRAIAATLASGVSRAGDLLARFGGEEFVVLLPATAHDAALAVAQRLAQRVRDLSLPHEASLHGVVTVSIGVATMEPTEAASPAALIAAAEDALRAAKGAGRNRVAGRHLR